MHRSLLYLVLLLFTPDLLGSSEENEHLDYRRPHLYVMRGIEIIQRSVPAQSPLEEDTASQLLAVAEVIYKLYKPAGIYAFSLIKGNPSQYGAVSVEAEQKMKRWGVQGKKSISAAFLFIQTTQILDGNHNELLLESIISQNLGKKPGASPLSAVNAAKELLPLNREKAIQSLKSIIEKYVDPNIVRYAREYLE